MCACTYTGMHTCMHTHVCTLACTTLSSLNWSKCLHGPSILLVIQPLALFPWLAAGPGHVFSVSWENRGILKQENGVYLLRPQLPLGSLAHPPAPGRPLGLQNTSTFLHSPNSSIEPRGRIHYKAVCCPLVKSWGITSRGSQVAHPCLQRQAWFLRVAGTLCLLLSLGPQCSASILVKGC